MKLHLEILAWISYLLLQIMAYIYISGPYYMIITGVILLIVYVFLLRKKQMLRLSSRDLNSSPGGDIILQILAKSSVSFLKP